MIEYQHEQWPASPQNLLVLDASFNPPTRAHMALVHAAMNHFTPNTFDACLLLFTTKNVDKALVGASASQRVAMMTLIAKKQTFPTSVGVTPHGRFIDKAEALAGEWPTTKFHFIVGYDTVIRLLDPVYYPEKPVHEALAPFFRNCKLICIDRDGYGDMDTFWKQNHQHNIERIRLGDPEIAALSSTLARSLEQDKLEMAVDDQVAEYIRAHGLYV